jgi:hypothetical protein
MAGITSLPTDYKAQQPYLFRDAEVFIGNISLNPERDTELIAVKLFGTPLHVDRFNVEDETTRLRVFAYSSVRGLDTAVEFPYFPKVGKYLGFIVGDDIQVELRGSNFYLTDIELEVQDGGKN